MQKIPDDIIHQLAFFCESNNLGLSQIGNKDLCIILIGDSNSMDVNSAAILAAHLLLGGVVDGLWNEAVKSALEVEKKESLN